MTERRGEETTERRRRGGEGQRRDEEIWSRVDGERGIWREEARAGKR